MVQLTQQCCLELKAQESSSCSVHKAECLSWSLVYAGVLKKSARMPVKEWTCYQDREQADRESKCPSSMSLYRMSAEAAAQARGDSSHLKRSGLKGDLSLRRFGLEMGLPTSNDLIKTKVFTGVPHHLRFS